MNQNLLGLLKWFGLPLLLLISILIGNVWWPFNAVVMVVGAVTVLWVLFLTVMGFRNMIRDFKKNKK